MLDPLTKKKKEPAILYFTVEKVSELEAQRGLNKAFDILFGEIFKNQLLSTDNSDNHIDNSEQLGV